MNELNLKVVSSFLYRYRYLISTSVLVFSVIFGISAYTKPAYYFSEAEIQLKKKDNVGGDVLTRAFRGDDFTDIVTLIGSSLIIDKVLKEVEIGKRYFYKENYKVFELYKNSPFVVDVEEMTPALLGKSFLITPLTNNTFQLDLKGASKWSLTRIKDLIKGNKKKSISYSKVHTYGEHINTTLFKIRIEKIHELTKKEYQFTYVPNEFMRGMIRGNISADFMGRGSSVLRVRYNDTVALRAQDIVNTVVKVFLKDQTEEKNLETDRSLKFLDRELEELNKSLNQSANKLKSFKQKNEIIGDRMSFGEITLRINNNKTEIRKMEVEKTILESIKIYMDTNQDLSGLAVNAEELSNSLLNKKIERYQKLNEELSQSLLAYTRSHPEVIKLDNELTSTWDNIVYIVNKGILKLEQKTSALKSENEAYKVSLNAAPQKELKLSNLTRDFSINNNLYAYLLERRAELAMLESSSISSSRVIEKASFIGVPYKPKRVMIVITGAILGFLFGVVLAYLVSLRDNTLQELDEIESLKDISIYGQIPLLTKKKMPVYDEAFRALRTNLEFIDVKDSSSKFVLISSAIAGEAKSTTIYNLANVVSQIDKKVIVLDMDLRRPKLHEKFGNINNLVGMSTLLSGQSDLNSSIQKVGNVDIITAGPTPPNPSELIMSEKFRLCINVLRKNYDYVLVDSAPYSVVTDAQILMKEADVVLFSVLLNKTEKKTLQSIKKISENLRLDAIGIIVSGVKKNRSENYGYGYYS